MLQSHILVREWSATMSEPEREEVLLHEVGHYLGAVHSPDPVSVMRPVLADNQAIRTKFQIGFDPVNTLLINLVSEEIRERRVTSVSELTARHAAAFGPDLRQAGGRDSRRHIGQAVSIPGGHGGGLAVGRRHAESSWVRCARRHEQRAAQAGSLRSDRLTEYYVRCAAAAARDVPADVAPAASPLGSGHRPG